MLVIAVLLSLLAMTPVTFSAPMPIFGIGDTTANGKPIAISQSTINTDLQRPAFFARLAYCSSAAVKTGNCGEQCDAVKGISVLQTGGDNGEIPRFFIATDPASQSIVVAHQGTHPKDFLSDLNDAKIAQVSMNSKLFPNAPSGTKVHDGFQETQGRTADLVLSTVKSALSSTGFKRVLCTGHSLGAAVAALDATMLRMNLPSSVEVDAIVFGLPRVGNQQFANMIDQLIPNFTHVTNQNDPVPILPPRSFNFQQPQGEFHITAVGSNGDATMEACPGQENSNCSEHNSLLKASIANHLGPYFNGISFGGDACSA